MTDTQKKYAKFIAITLLVIGIAVFIYFKVRKPKPAAPAPKADLPNSVNSNPGSRIPAGPGLTETTSGITGSWSQPPANSSGTSGGSGTGNNTGASSSPNNIPPEKVGIVIHPRLGGGVTDPVPTDKANITTQGVA